MNTLQEYLRTDRNGTKYYNDFTCPRCGGLGASDKWWQTGKTCYGCGGTGRKAKPSIVKIYTKEYEEKLASRRLAKINDNSEVNVSNVYVEEHPEETDTNNSNYIGEIGCKIELDATLESMFEFERTSFTGFGTEYVSCLKFKDMDENIIVWFTQGNTSKYEEGNRYHIKATVKAHTERNGEKQTKVIRLTSK